MTRCTSSSFISTSVDIMLHLAYAQHGAYYYSWLFSKLHKMRYGLATVVIEF